MYRIYTKCTLCISKKLEVMSKNGFQNLNSAPSNSAKTGIFVLVSISL